MTSAKHPQRIAATFERLKQQGRKALIPYVTAGFPHAQGTPSSMMSAPASTMPCIRAGVMSAWGKPAVM